MSLFLNFLILIMLLPYLLCRESIEVDMIKHAERLSHEPESAVTMVPFLNSFRLLSPEERLDIVKVYSQYKEDLGSKDALLSLAFDCADLNLARNFIHSLRINTTSASASAAASIVASDVKLACVDSTQIGSQHGLDQDALENYARIADNLIMRIEGNPCYIEMLHEFKRIGMTLLNVDKEVSGYLHTLISIFADLDERGRRIVYIQLGNITGNPFHGYQGYYPGISGSSDECVKAFLNPNRILDEYKTQIAISLYADVDSLIERGKLVLPAALPLAAREEEPLQDPMIPLEILPQPAPIKKSSELVAEQSIPSQNLVIPIPASIPAAAYFKGPWRFWNNKKRFVMPNGLQAKEEEYIAFFMNAVMPKLADLKASGKITDVLINGVIRGASMGLVGMVEHTSYLKAFTSFLDTLVPNSSRENINFYQEKKVFHLSYLESLSNRRRFSRITDENPFFREIGPKNNRISTFCSIHAENETRSFVLEYNKLRPKNRNANVERLKERAIETIRSKVLGLPQAIDSTFRFMCEHSCEDKIWVRFIQSFDTVYCYDATYDSIASAGVTITAGDSEKDQRLPSKIFVEILKNIPTNLEHILSEASTSSFVHAVKSASSGAENPDSSFLASQTIDQWFGTNAGTTIRTAIAQHCALADGQILELIYWNNVMNNEGIMPPGGINGEIARLFME